MRQAVPCLCAVLVVTCHAPAQSVGSAAAVASTVRANATFQPGDTFELNLGAVPAEDHAAFSSVYTVSGQGLVKLPYVRLVQVAGLTQSQLEKAIQNRLIEEKIFRWPTITINVPEPARPITVGGDVRAPARTYWSADAGRKGIVRPPNRGILRVRSEEALAEPVIRSEKPLPPELAKLFEPPPGFANQGGDYRSPLIFDDGNSVRTKADWEQRRVEIRKRWHEMMGPWPELIERPRCEILEETERDGFIQRRVRIQIAPDQNANGYLLLPKGKGPFPAVFVPFYEPETSIGLAKPHRDFAYQLTKRGFVTLSIGSPGGDARKPGIGEAICQPLSFLAYVAANCANYLGSLPEVDAARIGTVGHSYGGKWAMFAASLYDRFACGAWSDPGIVFDETRPNVNYWEPWYLGMHDGAQRKPGLPTAENPRTGAYAKMIEQKMDLHELHALMAPRPFFVSGGSEDPPNRWLALNHSVAVNRLLGFEQRVGMSNRPDHEPNAESNEQIYQFFQHFLKSKDDRE